VAAINEAVLTLTVRVAGVVALELVSVNQEPFATDVEKLTGAVEVMLID